jgi:hypothetical protein
VAGGIDLVDETAEGMGADVGEVQELGGQAVRVEDQTHHVRARVLTVPSLPRQESQELLDYDR